MKIRPRKDCPEEKQTLDYLAWEIEYQVGAEDVLIGEEGGVEFVILLAEDARALLEMAQ